MYACNAHVHVVQLWTIYTIHAKNKTKIYGLRPTRKVGCWTESLSDARGGG